MTRAALLAACASIAAAAGAHADTFSVTVFIDGLQEVPPVATPGSGQALVTADTDTREVSITGTFSGLIGSPTAAHLHGLAPVGMNAGILFGLTLGPGTISGSGILSEADFDGFMENLTYINIHSSFRPGGEIRGQVIVPAPGSLALLGFAGLAAARRRRP